MENNLYAVNRENKELYSLKNVIDNMYIISGVIDLNEETDRTRLKKTYGNSDVNVGDMCIMEDGGKLHFYNMFSHKFVVMDNEDEAKLYVML